MRPKEGVGEGGRERENKKQTECTETETQDEFEKSNTPGWVEEHGGPTLDIGWAGRLPSLDLL